MWDGPTPKHARDARRARPTTAHADPLADCTAVRADRFDPARGVADPTGAVRGAPFAGDKDEFVVLAPWVLGEDPSLPLAEDRDRMATRAREMLAGSHSEHENDYLETAVWADLVPPTASPGTAAPPTDGPGDTPVDPPTAPADPSATAAPAAPATRDLPVTGLGTAWGALLLLALAVTTIATRRRAT